MLFSRNPESGIVEAYQDNGVYSGHVFTLGDFIQNKMAKDGGPGSGNFGHKGRPGQVGGSSTEGGAGGASGGASGGKKLPKDWKSKLSKEDQDDVDWMIERADRDCKKGLARIKELENAVKNKYISKAKMQREIETNNLDYYKDGLSPEASVLWNGGATERRILLNAAKKVADWDKNKEELLKNLSDDDRELYEAMSKADKEFNSPFSQHDMWLGPAITEQLEGMAMGLIDEHFDVPQHIRERLGIGEKKSSTKELAGPHDYESILGPDPSYGSLNPAATGNYRRKKDPNSRHDVSPSEEEKRKQAYEFEVKHGNQIDPTTTGELSYTIGGLLRQRWEEGSFRKSDKEIETGEDLAKDMLWAFKGKDRREFVNRGIEIMDKWEKDFKDNPDFPTTEYLDFEQALREEAGKLKQFDELKEEFGDIDPDSIESFRDDEEFDEEADRLKDDIRGLEEDVKLIEHAKGKDPGTQIIEPEDGFDIFDLLGEFDDEDDPEEQSRREKAEREEKEREAFANHGLSEGEYPEELRLTKEERDAVNDLFRSHKDMSHKSNVSEHVMWAATGNMTPEVLKANEKMCQDRIEEANRMIAERKKEGYSFKDRTAGMSSAERKKAWWDYYNEHGEAPPTVGESGIQHWQIQRKKALAEMKWIGLEKKLMERHEFASKQSGYMPWRKNPRSNDPSYKPWAEDAMAADGGPGSGNFGHKGRPGKVGGSSKGTGGAQYRGGRSDIGYFGSRKDWLNGLSGESQHEAVRMIGSIKNDMEHSKKVVKRFQELKEKGVIDEEGLQERLKAANLENFDENDPPELYCIKTRRKAAEDLINKMKDARDWKKNEARLVSSNLSDEEQKMYSYLSGDVGQMKNLGEGDRDALVDVKRKLLLKAMGMDVPIDIEKEVPEEHLFESGLKERPKVERSGDYSWWEPSDERLGYYASSIERFMSSMLDGSGFYGHRFTKDEFIDLNQRFVDGMKYEKKFTPTQLSYYGIYAIRGIRESINVRKDFDYKKAIEKLSDEEKDRLLEVWNTMSNKHSMDPERTDPATLTDDDYHKLESWMYQDTPRSNAEKQMYRDYILIQEKMLMGVEPTSEEERARKAAEKAAEEAKKAAEEERKRQEKANSDVAAKEAAKKMREARQRGEKTRHPDGKFAQDVGADYYERVSSKMDECENLDIKTVWDIYDLEVPVKTITTNDDCWHPALQRMELNKEKAEKGDAIHAPFETVYHEFGHAIDQKAAAKLGYETSPYDTYPHLSSVWNNGEFLHTIESEGKEFLSKLEKDLKKEFTSVALEDRDDAFYEKYYMGTGEMWRYKAGLKEAKWDAATKKAAVENWMRSQPKLSIANMCDTIQGISRNKYRAVAGHTMSYYQGETGRGNVASELFAELYASYVANSGSLEMYKKYFPKTVECFGRMMKDIAERG